jgi:hypothetical protein
LATLFPAPRSVTIAGRPIEIKRCGIAQAGRIIDAGSGLYLQIESGAEFMDLFESDPDATSALIVAATGLDSSWVKSLDPLEQFELATAWMEVNAAFFVRRLLPSLARYRGALNAMFGDGQISSADSSAPATSTPATIPRCRPHLSPCPNAPIGARLRECAIAMRAAQSPEGFEQFLRTLDKDNG